MEETDQTIAPSANGKSAPFEGEDVGSIPTGASNVLRRVPANGWRAVPVEGKPFTFVIVDKVTGEPFSIPAFIEDCYAEGKCNKK